MKEIKNYKSFSRGFHHTCLTSISSNKPPLASLLQSSLEVVKRRRREKKRLKFHYILSFFLSRLHDLGEPSPLAHGIRIGDSLQGRVSPFQTHAPSSSSQVSPAKFHLVHDVFHVEVHVERHQSDATACQFNSVISTYEVEKRKL